MGKRRATKDRSFISNTERKYQGYGGYQSTANTPFRRLPFNCCAISFQPFDDPVVTPDGTIMDIVNAVPYIQKFHKHPVTGQPLQLKDLTKLNFTKNTESGDYCCPILGTIFNQNSTIVAIKTTGNVYSYEAIEKLCLGPKNLRDLQSDVPFSRKDIIHIQDPLNLSMKNLQEFDHVRKGLQLPINNNNNSTGNGNSNVNTTHASDDLKRVLGSLESTEAAAAFTGGGGGQRAQAERLLAQAKLHDKDKETGGNKEEEGDPRLRSEPRDLSQSNLNVLKRPGTATWNTEDLTAAFTASPSASSLLATTGTGDNNNINILTGGKKVPQPYSRRTITSVQTTGKTSRSLTSTTSTPATQNQRLLHTVQLKPNKKAYVRLHTNMGDLNIELHADMCPKTCENFVALVDGGYYNGTVFHRSVKNFMIQGGDPTGTGRGGVSIWGRTFENELDSRLRHDSRGVLGMANSGNGSGSGGGKGTNGSQFYILYKSAPHLDNKHTVFGRLVGGFDILTAMEKVPTTGDSGDEDRPVREIKIVGASVFVNPYKELLEKEEEEEAKGKEEEERRRKVKRSKVMDGGGGAGGGGTSVAVGKYLAGDDGSIMEAADQAKGKSNAVTAALSAFDAW